MQKGKRKMKRIEDLPLTWKQERTGAWIGMSEKYIHRWIRIRERIDRAVRNICLRDASRCTFPPISFDCAFAANRECTMEDTVPSFLTFRLSLIYLPSFERFK